MSDPAERTALAETLFRSDQDYFTAGAEGDRISGGSWVWMRGLEHVPAGCMIIPDLPLATPERFLGEAGRHASEAGASLLRFYTLGLDESTAAALLEAGLAANVEHGFVRAADGPPSRPAPLAGLRFRPLEGSAAWLDKLQLASSLELLPDGKSASAADWTELERRKCDAGYMTMWLIERDELVCECSRSALLRSKPN